MRNDAILNTIGVGIGRFALFWFLSLSLALALYCALLLGHFGVAPRDLVMWLKAGWPTATNKTAAAMLWLCAAQGVTTTSVVYLTIALWWKKRGGVQHRRGARRDWEE